MKFLLACICAVLFSANMPAQNAPRSAARRAPRPERAADDFKGPQHLAIVIDCSAQNKRAFERSIRLATRAIERLTEKDTVSIVVFDDAAELLLPATPVTDKAAILAKLQGLKPRGMKALFAGVAKGAEEVRRNKSEEQAKRVLLLVGTGTGKQIGPGDENELETLRKSLGKENITLVQPPAGPGGGSRDGDQPRRRKGERGGGAKRVE